MANPVVLPAGTTLGKSYEYGLDINLGTPADPSWQPVRRISGWAPQFAEVTGDIASYDDLGSENEEVTGRNFSGSFTVQANRSLTSGLYLPEVEALVAASRAKGEQAIVEVRFYHKPEVGTPHPTDAGQAFVRVAITRQNTGNADNEIFSVTLTGKGPYTPIPNPWQGWGAQTPAIANVSPAGQGSGELVTITGTSLLGATAVTVNSLPVDDYQAINASTIVAVLPTDAAGTVDVVVTTPGGVTPAFSYERAA